VVWLHRTQQDRVAAPGQAVFVRRPITARLREEVVRRYPAERALREIIGSAHQPFNPLATEAATGALDVRVNPGRWQSG
jgi:hypothetical protein